MSQLDENEDDYKFLKSFISGGFAGACAKTVIAPIERIKFLFVTRQKQFKYKIAFQEAKYIFQKHGIKNFWRGNSANLISILPFSAINFSTFDFLRDIIIQKISYFIFIGATAGVVAQSCTYPIEFLRTRMAMQKDNFKYNSLIHAFKEIYKIEGIRGFYRGLTLAIIGVFFYHGSGFFIITNLKEYSEIHYPKTSKEWYFDFAFGAFGATFSQVLAYPFDIMYKRKQGEALLVQTGEQKSEMTTSQMFKFYLHKEGFGSALFKGVTINMIKAPIANGTAWAIKNKVNRYIDSSYDF
ncbi:solute carrier family 25, putative [Ichthyophthirius multifiliis]|uniref:Solute carrier family 25, putative n=1 Tax=Ichthyophthirius multifiliis TaxID=5932 RepID=G0QTQ4_ICHMU|nr:solute carrier family 25, putative [Ichthyophthirius multifiliis]EGR31403.1 solute carrier family 25, putative [Ichthyophthirius multifiliis]|eukprot:XP_004034889.1 solute carrier family 25, putative [Ichthyophthirius multifiliis]